MNVNLLLKACTKFFTGLLLVGLLIFLPAGTVYYWNAWLLLAVLFIPMFIAGIVLLGSLIALVPFLFYPMLIVKRIKNEEKVLEAGLEGYTEYMRRVKYRLIPFVW